MARPVKPLIVRQHVLQHALDLIDEDGYDNFSFPRLAKRIGVRPPSLYHHFASRAELLTEAAQSVVHTVRLPPWEQPWREWCVQVALTVRETILSRTGVAPLLIWHLQTVGAPRIYQPCTEQLREHGLSGQESCAVTDALERLVLGFASVDAMRHRPQNPYYDDTSPQRYDDERSRAAFVAAVRSYLLGLEISPRP